MKKYILASIILSLSFLLVSSQTKKKNDFGSKFTTIIQLGILEGDAGKTFGQVQLVNGIQQNAWFYGLGIGVDYYGPKRSVPLFVDVKRDLKKGNKTPFIFADAGYNFSWLRDSEKSYIWSTNYKPTGGLYYEAGVGYKFILKNKIAFGFSAGYSFKEQKETYGSILIVEPPITGTANYNPPLDSYYYKFRRISIKFNCSF
jgi:hypothetical protein